MLATDTIIPRPSFMKLSDDCHIAQASFVSTLPILSASSIDLIVTSPPYWLNKEYERAVSWDEYQEMMISFFEQSYRVLTGGGYLVINFGDYFNSGNRFYDAEVPSVQPASPAIFAWGMSCGLDLQATRIWRKQFARMGIPFVCNHHPRNIFDYEHIWTFRKKMVHPKSMCVTASYRSVGCSEKRGVVLPVLISTVRRSLWNFQHGLSSATATRMTWY